MVSEDDQKLRKCRWTSEEDQALAAYIAMHGVGKWKIVQRCSGLQRSSHSCRERWMGHLQSSVKKGAFTFQEKLKVLKLHQQFGNKWTKIASHFPDRRDTAVRNYMHNLLRRRERAKLKASEFQRLFSSVEHIVGVHSLPLLPQDGTTSGFSGDLDFLPSANNLFNISMGGNIQVPSMYSSSMVPEAFSGQLQDPQRVIESAERMQHCESDANRCHVYQNEMNLAHSECSNSSQPAIAADLDELLGDACSESSKPVDSRCYNSRQLANEADLDELLGNAWSEPSKPVHSGCYNPCQLAVEADLDELLGSAWCEPSKPVHSECYNSCQLAVIEADLNQLLGNGCPEPSNIVQACTVPYSLYPENLHESDVISVHPSSGDLNLLERSSESSYTGPLLNSGFAGTHAEHSDCVQYSEPNQDPSWEFEVLIRELLF